MFLNTKTNAIVEYNKLIDTITIEIRNLRKRFTRQTNAQDDIARG